ncbi:MAG TPA: nitroreductase family deazaflavin-dependent oxidoreductase [Candidatus Limnocylindria bacterium]
MFERLADADVAYLTTTGRRTGRRHRIEIWFALENGVVYLLSGGGHDADWVRNIAKHREVRIQVGSRSVAARARLVRARREDARARELLDAKYMEWRPGRQLSSWASGAVPVAIDLPR